MSGPNITRYHVPNASWERSKKLDIGLDLTLFRHWNIVADYFYEKRFDATLYMGGTIRI